MKCPSCGYPENKVLDTRSIDDDRSVRRRRECLKCQFRFTTYETIETLPLMVCKSDNTREPFNRTKIMNGLIKACQKRPISVRQMQELVDAIETEFQNTLRSEVSTKEIGERIMNGLRRLDKVAYIRFVSVYRKFDDVNSFTEELERIKNDKY
ncbi:MAG: transcriptional repressor NrdR [Clostridiales bacterium]|nr:transcriptional repressor NrdR [Clostridiales bacterium]